MKGCIIVIALHKQQPNYSSLYANLVLSLILFLPCTLLLPFTFCCHAPFAAAPFLCRHLLRDLLLPRSNGAATYCCRNQLLQRAFSCRDIVLPRHSCCRDILLPRASCCRALFSAAPFLLPRIFAAARFCDFWVSWRDCLLLRRFAAVKFFCRDFLLQRLFTGPNKLSNKVILLTRHHRHRSSENQKATWFWSKSGLFCPHNHGEMGMSLVIITNLSWYESGYLFDQGFFHNKNRTEEMEKFDNRGLTQLHESYTRRADAEVKEVFDNGGRRKCHRSNTLPLATHWSCASNGVFVKLCRGSIQV